MTPEVSVIIVNFNSERHLDRCLASVYAAPPPVPMEVLVVDNASADGSMDMIRRQYPQTRVLLNRENLGFSRANNLGIAASAGQLIVLLNNDTVVFHDSLAGLVTAMTNNPDVGVVGPRLLNGDGSVQISYGTMIGFRNELTQKVLRGLYEREFGPVRRYVERRSRRRCYPDWVSGACMMIRRRVLDDVGLLDENFFMYTEEVDLCARIRASGWRVLYVPDVDVVHFGGQSTQLNLRNTILEYRRSQLYFYRKHHTGVALRALKAYLLVKLSLHWTWHRLKPGRWDDRSRRLEIDRTLLSEVWKY